MRGGIAMLFALAAGLAAVCPAEESPKEAPETEADFRPLCQEPVEVQRYVLQRMRGEALAYSEALSMPVRSAERQALVLFSHLRVLNEISADALPEGHRNYVQGLREIGNDLTPRIAALFLSVAAGELEEDLLTETLAPLEAEKASRTQELDAKYPEAAKDLGEEAMQTRWLAWAQGTQSKGKPTKRDVAEAYRELAKKIDGILQKL